jgi:starch synthase
MNILVVAAEVAPFAKVGGLADMASALPKAWANDGHKVAVVLPKYGHIDASEYGLRKVFDSLTVPFGQWNEYASVWTCPMPGAPDVPVYFVESTEYYDRPGIYGYHEGFEDNDRRFLFLSCAAFELCKALDFAPTIVHAHDYHTAPCMPLLKVRFRHDPFFQHTRGVFTIHNMAYQGMYDPARAMEFCRFPVEDFYHGSWYEQDGVFNCLKAGIMFADKVTTVSPTYAQEIRWTPEGMGLQGALQARSAHLLGILNGIDPTEWSPALDTHIPVNYSAATVERKEISKLALLRSFGLDEAVLQQDLPLIGMVTRLTDQKGIPIVAEVLEEFVAAGHCRFVMLGSGERKYEEYFLELARRYPNNALIGTGYNAPLSHLIQAASDYYLMPSRFEPCGLTQMFALAYGTIPVVRATGGLADTVVQYDPVSFTGTGFRFAGYTGEALRSTMYDALRLYKRAPHWDAIRANAMAQDNSITTCARRYVELFGWAAEV